jgi:hypothetical protein
VGGVDNVPWRGFGLVCGREEDRVENVECKVSSSMGLSTEEGK